MEINNLVNEDTNMHDGYNYVVPIQQGIVPEVTKRYSSFLVTINPNYHPLSNQLPALNSSYSRAIDHLLKNNFGTSPLVSRWYETNNFPPYLQIVSNDLTSDMQNAKIYNVQASVALEIGDRGALHAHILLDICHNTKVLVNCEFIRENFWMYLSDSGFRKMDESGSFSPYRVYCNSRFIQSNDNTRNNLLRYIHKSDKNFNLIKDERNVKILNKKLTK